MEPILIENSNRFVLTTDHKDLDDFYQKHKASFWVPQEIDFAGDMNDWQNKLNYDEKYFIKHVLAFFAASDGIVNENLAMNFYNEVQYPEARAFYSFQQAMETIHSETYKLLIETYVKDRDEQQILFRAVENFPAIKDKADWALNWTTRNVPYATELPSEAGPGIDPWAAPQPRRQSRSGGVLRTQASKGPGVDSKNASFAERLIAFVAVEGIFFSGSFCSIFWLKKRGLMPGLTFSNELISRDEALHCDFAINLYNNHIKYKISCDRIKQILLSALTIERSFITEALPAKLLGMNSNLMIQYLEFVTDRLLMQLHCEKEFNSQNPFDFMEMISLEGKTNFFEKRVGDYQKAGVLQKFKDKITFDEDF